MADESKWYESLIGLIPSILPTLFPGTSAGSGSGSGSGTNPPYLPPPQKKTDYMTPVIIGVSLIIFGTLLYLVIKTSKKG